jgi:predicted phage terminase large subunit-like protein
VGCSVCDSMGVDHETMVKACRDDLFVTARFLCQFRDVTPRFHKKLCDWVRNNIRSGDRNMMVLLPRGHLKTHVLALAGSAWMIINNPDTRILFMQSSGRKATENMYSLSSILDSEIFKHYFGDIIPDRASRRRWNQNEIEVNRAGNYPEATITARGVGSRITGGHYDCIISDDLIDLEDADSDTTMDSAITWHKHSTPLFVDPSRGLNIVIGTRWSESDLYGWVKANQKMYQVLEAGCFADERCAEWDFAEPGDPIWPERFSKEVLEQIHDKINDDFIFSHQYLNIPLSDELRRFKERDIQWYKWEEANKEIVSGERKYRVEKLFKVLTVDPSVGESRDSDESAIVVTGIDRKSANIFVLEAWAERVITPDLISKIMELHERWSPHVTGIEDAGFQKTLKYPLRQQMMWSNRQFAIVPLKHGGKAKFKRIEGVTPYVANQQVFMRKDHGKLLNQLLSFHPSMKGHDDLIDALAYHVQFWKSTRPEMKFTEEEDEDSPRPEKRVPAYGLSCTT